MIRKTLLNTKQATFAIVVHQKGMHPLGTGFFISPDGWFVTAAHVVTDLNQPSKPLRDNIEKAWLMQESRTPPDKMYQHISVEFVDNETDFALLKIDFDANKNKASLQGKTGFPYIEVSSRELEEGEPVYSFGYPLSSSTKINDFMGVIHLSPRATSAIVSSIYERIEMVETDNDPKIYVLDKALNYGNSGGPIIATETGKVHALCSRFQPVQIPQPHLKDQEDNPLFVSIPSLYGVVRSLGDPRIMEQLSLRQIPISDS